MLTSTRLRALLDYCPETGQFKWVRSRGSVKAGAVAGGLNANGYVQIQVDGTNEYGHRLAWLYVHGVWPSETIDHLNGDASDNRIANLRDVGHRHNIENQRRAAVNNKSSGMLGVSRSGNRWRAHIVTEGKQRHLGCFESRELAYSAYLEAKRTLHSGCTL